MKKNNNTRIRVFSTLLSLVLVLTFTNHFLVGQAFAHHPIISGTVTCTASYQQQINWTLQNSETTGPMTITAINPSITGIAVGDSDPVGVTLNGYQLVAGTQTGTVTLTVTGSWPDGVTDTDSESVTLSGQCVAPTPTPTPHPTATPTPTPIPLTTMYMTVYLDGIGYRGDNTNPTDSSDSNKNPLHQTIAAQTEIYTTNNKHLNCQRSRNTYI
jgi:hypothetical protein